MKLGETQNQEIKSVFASRTEVVKTTSNNASEAAHNNENAAGSASKMGEFLNQTAQAKQQFLAKALSGSSTAAQTSGLGTEATVTKVGDQVIIDAGAGDDKIGVTQDAAGNVTVEVNGKKQSFTGKDKDNLVIKAGEGNDTIAVDKNVTVKLTLEGGAGSDVIAVDKAVKINQEIDGGDGDDKITGGSGDDKIKGGAGSDKIEAGEGNDEVDGGEGRDYINGSKGTDKLAGGAGNDVIYGGDDADEIDGGDGDDYLEGSKGNDTITGGKGKDILSGGMNDDTLKGGDGDDVIYAGEGKDSIFGEKGNNKIFSQTGDTDDSSAKGVKNTVVTVDLSKAIGSKVIVSGTPEFKERVEADIEMLRSSETGRKMLGGMDNSGKTLTIVQYDSLAKAPQGKEKEYENMVTISRNQLLNNPDPKTKSVDTWGHLDSKGNTGSQDDAVIGYDVTVPLLSTDDIPPSLGLYHEMTHAYNIMTGTMQNGYYKGDGKAASADNDNPSLDKNGKIIEDPNQSVRNSERQAVGLSNDGVRFNDDDGDDLDNNGKKDSDPKKKATEKTKDNPEGVTENALRDELNIKRRNIYRKL